MTQRSKFLFGFHGVLYSISPENTFDAAIAADQPPLVPPIRCQGLDLRPVTLIDPVTRGGNPVCWVNKRPFTGIAGLSFVPVEFLRLALV